MSWADEVVLLREAVRGLGQSHTGKRCETQPFVDVQP